MLEKGNSEEAYVGIPVEHVNEFLEKNLKEGNPKGILGKTSEGIPGETPEEIPEEIPGKAAVGIP